LREGAILQGRELFFKGGHHLSTREGGCRSSREGGSHSSMRDGGHHSSREGGPPFIDGGWGMPFSIQGGTSFFI